MARVRVTVSESLNQLPVRLRRNVVIAQTAQKLYAETVIKQSIRSVGAVASKQLLDTIESQPVIVAAPVGKIAVGSPVKQAFWIENGRRPGPVPRWAQFKPILRAWAAAKGLDISDSGLWFIAKKIRAEGFTAREPFKKARAAMAGGLFRFITDGIRKAIAG